jgi:hypothetical protein
MVAPSQVADAAERLGDFGHVVEQRDERAHALGDGDRRTFIGEGHCGLGAEIVNVRAGAVGGLAVAPLVHRAPFDGCDLRLMWPDPNP